MIKSNLYFLHHMCICVIIHIFILKHTFVFILKTHIWLSNITFVFKSYWASYKKNPRVFSRCGRACIFLLLFVRVCVCVCVCVHSCKLDVKNTNLILLFLTIFVGRRNTHFYFFLNSNIIITFVFQNINLIFIIQMCVFKINTNVMFKIKMCITTKMHMWC